MLIELRLKDFGLSDALRFEPGRGLVAVTGETGAGKSLLVTALAFVIGDRAQAECIRSGAESCDVSAVFEPQVREAFSEWLAGSESTLVLRRELAKTGKSRAWINDRPVPVAALKRAGVLLCDLHGQHQHQWLLDPHQHAAYLDCFADQEARSRYRGAFELWQRSQTAQKSHRERLEEDLKRKDFWEFQQGELDRIQPRPGEYEELEALRARLRSEGERSQLLQLLEAELDGAEDSLIPRLVRLLERLESGCTAGAGMEEWATLLRSALVSLQEAGTALSRLETQETLSESSLEAVEQRLHSLYGLKKKFGGSLEVAIAERDKIAEHLQYLEHGEREAKRLVEFARQARSTLQEAGGALSEARSKAAVAMQKALRQPLADLDLGNDPVSVVSEPLELESWTEAGPSRIEFMLQANPGEEPKALAKIASGGELSRIMLGLKSVLPGRQGVSTLVFDEIDAGIGGETAARVAGRLEVLARGRQVIVITHLHQIAARAAQQFEVRKRTRGGRHVPEVKLLDSSERQAALARLIAGLAAPRAAQARARAILKRGSK